MWLDPYGIRSFELASADGTVLAVLPPLTRIESDIGESSEWRYPAPPGGRYRVVTAHWEGTAPAPLLTTDDQQQAYQRAYDAAVAGKTDVWVQEWSGETGEYEVVETFGGTVPTTATISDAPEAPDPPKPRPTNPEPPEDHYTWDRPPFSQNWYALGDGFPREKPKPPAPAGARYRVSPAYWGSTPASVTLTTDDAQAAWMGAYNAMVSSKTDHVVAEWRPALQGYEVVDTLVWPEPGSSAARSVTLEAPRPRPPKTGREKTDQKQLVLTCTWLYGSGDEALIHIGEIERAVAEATQLLFRGRTLALLAAEPPSRFITRPTDRLREMNHTLTLSVAERFTAQAFMRGQLT